MLPRHGRTATDRRRLRRPRGRLRPAAARARRTPALRRRARPAARVRHRPPDRAPAREAAARTRARGRLPRRRLAATRGTSGCSPRASRAPARTRSRSAPRRSSGTSRAAPRSSRSPRRATAACSSTTCTIHESFFLTDLDVTYLDGIPVTRPARVHLRPGAPRRTRRAPPEHARARAPGSDPPRPRRHPARLARVGTTRRRVRDPAVASSQELLNNFVPPIRKPDTHARDAAAAAAPRGRTSRSRCRSTACSCRRRASADSTSRGPTRRCTASSIRTSGTAGATGTCATRTRRLELDDARLVRRRRSPTTSSTPARRSRPQLLRQRLARAG